MSAEPRRPAICNVSNIGEGKDEMTKASIDLQDLRRRIYVKAKAEPSWRFWGLYVHVCKMETLRAAYEMAKRNDGAPGIDGVTFEAIEAQGVEALLEQLRDELIGRTYQPLLARRQEIPKDGGKIRVLSIPAILDRGVQGGVISPLLSNLYLNEVDKMLERAREVTRKGKYTYIEYARFADDLVILIDAYKRHDWLVGAVDKRVCTENLNTGVVVMKSAKDGA